jgi:hypothetical protein
MPLRALAALVAQGRVCGRHGEPVDWGVPGERGSGSDAPWLALLRAKARRDGVGVCGGL